MATLANHGWVPSTARLVVLDGFGAVPRGSLALPLPPLSWPAKDPGDTLDYVLDISEAVAGNEGDAIATLDVQIFPDNPGDLVLQSSAADGTQAVLWLAQGVPGTTYDVNVTIGTNGGRVLARTLLLPVASLTIQPVPPTAITDASGAPLQAQTLAPVTTA